MGRFTVLVIYRSPSNDGDLELFISDLERYCDSRVRDRTYWIVGDINCCILDSARSAAAERYLDVLHAAGFVACVDRPTRVTAHTAHCIDHIFVDAYTSENIISVVIKTTITLLDRN
ncbi:hypothetical protein J6590_073831 [Homalodisca vitripennis]|nr:hypothetical protein J6590_073831 [Homalodisca vitripennis]